MDRSARALLAFLHNGDPDDAYTGAMLLAEALRTIRDFDANNPYFKRSAW